MQFKAALKRVIDLGIPPGQLSPERLRRVRVLSCATFGLCAFAGVPWFFQYIRLDLPGLAAALGVTMVAAVANLEVLHRTHRDIRAGNIGIAALATFIAISSLATGGFDSPNYAWFFLVPLCGAAIIDLRGAAVWTVAMLAITAGFWALEGAGWVSKTVPEAMSGSALVFDRMLLILAIGVIGASFVHGQRGAEHQLSAAKDEAELEATYRGLLMHAAVAASEAGSLREAMDDSIRRICEAMGWAGGSAYDIDELGAAQFGGVAESLDEALAPLRAFIERRTAAPGAGSIGRAVATGKPVLATISFDRMPAQVSEATRRAGLTGVFAVPVPVRGEVRAVMEFALTETPADTGRLADVFSLIGSQLGKVAERTQLQEHLRQRQKMEAVGQLAAGVAHEINNPMSYVRSNLHSLRGQLDEFRAKGDEADLDEFAGLIEESLEGVEHTIRIVRDIREFSHMGSAGTSERIVASLAEVADGAWRVASGRVPSGVRFESHHGDEAHCLCAPHQIQQVIVNLLVNAWHAVGDSGSIRIETGATATHGWIRVSDDGCGIAAADQARLFEPFFTTKPVGQGTGLGLSVSYEIARSHGGEIRVDSRLGEGTRFELLLPLAGDGA